MEGVRRKAFVKREKGEKGGLGEVRDSLEEGRKMEGFVVSCHSWIGVGERRAVGGGLSGSKSALSFRFLSSRAQRVFGGLQRRSVNRVRMGSIRDECETNGKGMEALIVVVFACMADILGYLFDFLGRGWIEVDNNVCGEGRRGVNCR